MELAKWTFPIISLCREPYEAKVSRTGLTGGMGRRTVRQRALCLPSNSKDYERSVASSTAMIQISHIHLMLNRLAPCGRPEFHYRKDAA